MGSFDDLDNALLESVLKWLNSTELRNSACLICKRWLHVCNSRPTLWRDLDINVAWEAFHPHGPGRRVPAPLTRTAHRGFGYSSVYNEDAGGHGCGRSGGGGCGSAGRWRRPAFLSRVALARWLRERAPRVEVLRISHTEIRTTVVGYGRGACDQHDLQQSDLMSLLGSLPYLTELHLMSACNLLPDPSALVNLTPPAPAAAAAAASAAAAPAVAAGAAAAAAAATAVAAAAAAAAAAHRQLTLLAPPPPTAAAAAAATAPSAPTAPPPPLVERLQRLSLRLGGYDFHTDEGLTQAAALGSLRGLHELTITLDPPAEEGLTRLPDAWSALTGLTALRLGGHRRLRRLPRWLSSCLTGLQELELEGCGLRRLPVEPLSGLSGLRLLSLDRCPLGRGSAAVSLDAWWPPEEEKDEEGPGPDPAQRGSAGTAAAVAAGDPPLPAAAFGGGSGWAGWSGGTQGMAWEQYNRGNGGGVGGSWGAAAAAAEANLGGVRERFKPQRTGEGISGLEVLQLRDCDILALPYTMTRLTNLRRLELGGNPLGEVALPECGDRGRGGHTMRAYVLRCLAESGDRGFGQLVTCSRLVHLGLERCGLGGVPLGVPELTQITSLDLSHNRELELYDTRTGVPGSRLAGMRAGVQLAGLAARLQRLSRLRLVDTAAGQQLRESGLDVGVRTLILG